MTKLKFISFFIGIAFTAFAPLGHGNDFDTTSKFYAGMFEPTKTNEALLTLFFNQMPKGGDIHHHYSGTIYAETYLDWVKANNWFIDSSTLKIVKEAKRKQGEGSDLLTVDQLIANDALYRKLLTLWSDKDFSNHYHLQPPPDKNFFGSFFYFSPVMDEKTDVGLNIIKNRAIKEQVSYIEIMLTEMGVYTLGNLDIKQYATYNNALRNADSQSAVNKILNELKGRFLEDGGFKKSIDHYISNVEKYHQGIDDDQFTMRYQAYALRVIDPVMVFKDLLAAYIATDKSPLVVGVNILGPENNTVALNDYTLHMRMFNFLSNDYPDVKKSLHAGELTLGMVRPKDLNFHIQQAREIAKAQRIGHGIDIMYEQNAPALLKDLKENSVIEINLTSNEFILGVKGQRHPYLIYSDFNVPLVISSDDTGVSRNNLSDQYLLLATRYRPSYKQIKGYVYNSIKYSFLNNEDKKRLKSQLNTLFIDFEHKMSELYNSRNISQ